MRGGVGRVRHGDRVRGSAALDRAAQHAQALLVAGCAVATLFTAALETKQARADTTAALLRLGAPASVLRNAALLRAGVLLAVFGPLTWLVAELAAMPLAR